MRVSLMRQMAAEATAVLNKRPNETSVTSGKLAKPLLRGLLGRSTRKHAIICFALSISAAMAYRYTVGEPRKKRYAEFWKWDEPLSSILPLSWKAYHLFFLKELSTIMRTSKEWSRLDFTVISQLKTSRQWNKKRCRCLDWLIDCLFVKHREYLNREISDPSAQIHSRFILQE
jgi:hypothetical protein